MKIYERATEDHINAVYYHQMYWSEACWKKVREMNNGLKKLNTKKDKYNTLKENIQICVIGFGWKNLNRRGQRMEIRYPLSFLQMH